MPLSRRDFLRLGSWVALSTSLSGCSVIAREWGHELPENLPLPPAGLPLPATPDKLWRLLNRAGYAPRPGEYQTAAELGFEAYLESQLHPENITDHWADLRLNNLTMYQMDHTQLLEQESRDAFRELVWHTLGRRLYSQRQLYEVMVEFWSDHFHIYGHKNQNMPMLKLLDDRDVIRPHALGNFRDLLFASAYSPAMLVYLDNARNLKAHPNENYARELLELHTLGVHGGYTQQDVQEAARILTGLGVKRRQGVSVFNLEEHDDEAKMVMGQPFPAGQGEADITQLLNFLATHPQTAHFIATKLVRRFVADDPPAELVEQVAQTFLNSDGDIKAMLRVIFLSDQFAQAPVKLKRPLQFLLSALRSLNVDVQPNGQLVQWVQLLGQPPYIWPAPNGYPDVAQAWTGNLLVRWNFALNLATQRLRSCEIPFNQLLQMGAAETPETAVALWAQLLFGRGLPLPTQEILLAYTGQAKLTGPRWQEALALLLASPEFQYT